MPKQSNRQAGPSGHTILILDEHEVLCGLTQLIRTQPDLRLETFAGPPAEAFSHIIETRPELVVVFFAPKDRKGLKLIREIRDTSKEMKLLVVSTRKDITWANKVLGLGADGYVLKQEYPEEIIQAIRDVLNGHIYLSEEILSGSAETARPSGGPTGRAKTRLRSNRVDPNWKSSSAQD